MKFITFTDIVALNIKPDQCVKWVEEALKIKYDTILPPKISTSMSNGKIFFNTMPCLIPSLEKFGLKEVSRFPNRNPSLSAEILLYDSSAGDCLALLDGDWITTMRTGAVAATAIKLLEKKEAVNYSFMGLGNTARATLLCLIANNPKKLLNIKLLRYKDQTELFIDRFKAFDNLKFTIIEDKKSFIEDADVIVSCVSVAEQLIGKDEWFQEGVLVVPVHTRGFQNCDLFFDKVFADDEAHVRGFKNFNKFKKFEELSRVILETVQGRENEKEKILSYNIGLALHDVYFASKIYERMMSKTKIKHSLNKPSIKFWL